MRNKIINVMLVLTVGAVLLFAGLAFAQTTATPTPAQPNPSPAQPVPAQPSPVPPSPAPAPPNGKTPLQPTGQTVGPGAYDPGHPAVNEVNTRLEQQKRALEQGVKNGTITNQQAHQMWQNDQRIARQENKDLHQNGGHLTKQEQQQLNRKLNQNGRQIHQEKTSH